MDDEIRSEITLLVRTGFHAKADLVEIVCEERYEPGELDPEEVAAAIDDAWAALVAEQDTWPAETDCERLDRVFAALAATGTIALQNAGNTQSDGYESVRDELDQLREGSGDASHITGYCFYQGQDLDRVVRGEGLYLAFGPIDPEKEETEGPVVGKRVVAALTREGFAVDWDGTFAARIRVKNIVWRRRVT